MSFYKRKGEMMKKENVRKAITIFLFSVLIGTVGVPFLHSVENQRVLADREIPLKKLHPH
jgi:hypothetical protein